MSDPNTVVTQVPSVVVIDPPAWNILSQGTGSIFLDGLAKLVRVMFPAPMERDASISSFRRNWFCHAELVSANLQYRLVECPSG